MFYLNIDEDKKMVKNILNVCSYTIVNFALFIVYLYVFGQHSIRKYLAKAVITTEMEERPSRIPSPGIIFFLNSTIQMKVAGYHEKKEATAHQ